MTLSFYGFVLCVMMLLDELKIERMKSDMPTKGLRIFLFVSGVMIFFMWIGRIVPTIGKGTAPAGLDNCTTLVIQAMDMASFVIFGPICIASYIFFFIIMRKIGRYNKSINEG